MRRLTSQSNPRRGFSLVEAMTASLIVTVAGAAMLLGVGQALQESNCGIDTSRANQMAQELMHEISACRWADVDKPAHWGPEDGERVNRTRLGFDDLDDYDGWSGPPQTKDGTPYDSWQSSNFSSVSSHPYAAYTCAVSVAYVSSAGEPLLNGQTSPYRRVTVEVTHKAMSPHRLSQSFSDVAKLLGRDHWFDPNASDATAAVEIVP